MLLLLRTFALLGALALAGGAGAVPQFVPTGGELLHTTSSGQPGAEWNTSGLLSGGEISYSSGTGILSATAVLDVLNYYDPGDGACPTDVGSNCSINFGPDLDITFEAEITAIDIDNLGGGIINIFFSFGTVAGGGADLVVTDPDDGDSLQLEADWIAGTFNGSPTSGLQALVTFNLNTGTSFFDASNSVGVLDVDGATALSSLFGGTQLGINLGTFDDFSPSLSAIGAGLASNCGITLVSIPTSCATGDLPSFTAEANSQVFRTASGQFVPEPGGLALLGAGLLGLAYAGRRRQGA